MPLYNVSVAINFTMVVQADDESHAFDVADNSYKEDMVDNDPHAVIAVTGGVIRAEDLRDGWDAECIPYGGDRNTRIGELLKAQGERNEK